MVGAVPRECSPACSISWRSPALWTRWMELSSRGRSCSWGQSPLLVSGGGHAAGGADRP